MAGAPPSSTAKLYTPRLLSLAAELANYPLTPPYQNCAETRSRTCGSILQLGVDRDPAGRVERLGMQVTACAIGQASAAVMALSVKDRPASDFDEALAQIETWLAGSGEAPQWPGFDALEPALAHAGRHGALLLPWKAMVEALSSPASTR